MLDVFPLDGKTCFFILFGENVIFRKRFEVATYFYFILFKEKKRKKTLSVTLEGKTGL